MAGHFSCILNSHEMQTILSRFGDGESFFSCDVPEVHPRSIPGLVNRGLLVRLTKKSNYVRQRYAVAERYQVIR